MARLLHGSVIFGRQSSFNNWASATSSRPKLQIDKPGTLRQWIKFYGSLSYITAGIHYGLISTKLLISPSYLPHDHREAFRMLKNIWCARLVRRLVSILVRSPFRGHTLRLVSCSISLPSDSGCVIAICHTPWKRLLVQWCLENDFALVVANGTWSGQKKLIQRQAKGFNDLRKVVRHLQQKGKVIVTCDNFNDLTNCPVKFFGNWSNASLVPARLARMAGVPLIAAIPILRNGTINIESGPRFYLNNPISDLSAVTQDLISFLEAAITNTPDIWSPFVQTRIFGRSSNHT